MGQSLATLGIKVSADGAEKATRDLDNLSAASKRAEKQVALTTKSLDKAGMSAKQLQAATRGLPAQFTDIATSIASGQQPLTVLLQQGGQLKDMFGGVGGATRAMGGYIAGLANPLTIAAAAVGGFGYAWYKASDQMREAQNVLILSGNVMGTTTAEIDRMADSIVQVSGTVGSAREALLQIAASGKFTGEVMGDVAAAAAFMEEATGKASEETIKAFELIAGDPVKGLLKLNDEYHFLTGEVYTHIKALQDQGREEEAVSEAMRIASGAVRDRALEVSSNANIMVRAWNDVKRAASEAWAEMARAMNFAMSDKTAKTVATYELDGLARRQRERAAGLRDGSIKYTPGLQKAIDADTARINANIKVLGTGGVKSAKKAGGDQLKLKALADWDKEHDRYLTRAEQKEREIVRTRNLGVAAGKSEAQIQEQIAKIEARYADKPSGGGRKKTGGRSGKSAAERAQERLDKASERERLKQVKEFNDGVNKRIKTIMREEQATIDFTEALDRQNAELKDQFQFQLEAMTLGSDEIAQRQQLARITDEQTDKQRELAEQLRIGAENGGISQATYDKQLAALNDYTEKRIAIVMEGNRRIAEAEANWQTGASKAMADYIEQGQKTASMTEQAFTNAFGGMENALTQWITTGKADWKGLFDSILQDFIRMEVRILMSKALKYLNNDESASGGNGGSWLNSLGALFSSNKGGFGGGQSLYGGGLAVGGNAKAGMFYQVNERGTELLTVRGKDYLMMGRDSGRVTPTEKLQRAGGGITQNNTFHLAAPTDPRTQQQIAKQAGYETRRAVARNA